MSYTPEFIDIRDKKIHQNDRWGLTYKDSQGKYYDVKPLCHIPWGENISKSYKSSWYEPYFPFFTPNQEGKKLTEIKFELAYTLDEVSKISKFNITPNYKK